MSETGPTPHPLNVDGPFYVENNCCTLCSVPYVVAPDMFRVNGEEDHCYVYKQPENDEQLDRMFRVIEAVELQCVRCRTNDISLLEKLRQAGHSEQCDVEA